MKLSSSFALTFSKQDTAIAKRHLMALDPNHKLHVDAISETFQHKIFYVFEKNGYGFQSKSNER